MTSLSDVDLRDPTSLVTSLSDVHCLRRRTVQYKQHIGTVTLTLDLFTSALPATVDVGNLFFEFERCIIFCFRVNVGRGTDRQTDGRTD